MFPIQETRVPLKTRPNNDATQAHFGVQRGDFERRSIRQRGSISPFKRGVGELASDGSVNVRCDLSLSFAICLMSYVSR